MAVGMLGTGKEKWVTRAGTRKESDARRVERVGPTCAGWRGLLDASLQPYSPTAVLVHTVLWACAGSAAKLLHGTSDAKRMQDLGDHKPGTLLEGWTAQLLNMYSCLLEKPPLARHLNRATRALRQRKRCTPIPQHMHPVQPMDDWRVRCLARDPFSAWNAGRRW